MLSMRSQISNSGKISEVSDHKKSVFDRLGFQPDIGRPMKPRPSPGHHGEYLPPMPVHEGEFMRYSRDPLGQAELDWRYQSERRLIPPFPRERHPLQLGPSPQPPPLPSHYDVEMAARQNPYFPHPQHPYHSSSGPPPIAPLNMSIGMHPQRTSPKYDRHGNIIVSSKERSSIRIEQYHGVSPPRNFMPNPMMGIQPSAMRDMIPIRPGAIYPPHRWPDDIEPEFSHPMAGRMMLEDRFSPIDNRRFQHPQPQRPLLNEIDPHHPMQLGDFPRYARWRERRDVITTLDRETAQSSSKTDSLKSTLQQPDSKINDKSDVTASSRPKRNPSRTVANEEKNSISPETSELGQSSKLNEKSVNDKTDKAEPQEISDGEIVDDETSSDGSEPAKASNSFIDPDYMDRAPAIYRGREPPLYYEPSKKRRMHEREDYSMDYETISDDDLDDFMGGKKIQDLGNDDDKLASRLDEEKSRSVSEMELLNALGLDWAHLVEMAKQSKTPGRETCTPSSALARFSVANYVPTLGITTDLAGPFIYDLILKVCRT